MGAGFAGESPDVDRWGIFLISLYLDCLHKSQLSSNHVTEVVSLASAYVGGAAVVPSFLSVIMSMS